MERERTKRRRINTGEGKDGKERTKRRRMNTGEGKDGQ